MTYIHLNLNGMAMTPNVDPKVKLSILLSKKRSTLCEILRCFERSYAGICNYDFVSADHANPGVFRYRRRSV